MKYICRLACAYLYKYIEFQNWLTLGENKNFEHICEFQSSWVFLSIHIETNHEKIGICN